MPALIWDHEVYRIHQGQEAFEATRKRKRKKTQPSVFFHRFSCTPKEQNYMKWNSKIELLASERLSVKGCDVLQEPWEEMRMRDPRTSFHFRIWTFSLCCFLGKTYLSTTYQVLCLSLSVCLSYTRTPHVSVNSIAIEPQNSARGLVHRTHPQPWSSGLWRRLMSFPKRSPDQRGKCCRLKRRHVGACEQVKDGREREAPRKPRRHTCTLQLPDTRENSRGGVVWSTLSCGADEVLADIFFLYPYVLRHLLWTLPQQMSQTYMSNLLAQQNIHWTTLQEN